MLPSNTAAGSSLISLVSLPCPQPRVVHSQGSVCLQVDETASKPPPPPAGQEKAAPAPLPNADFHKVR